MLPWDNMAFTEKGGMFMLYFICQALDSPGHYSVKFKSFVMNQGVGLSSGYHRVAITV